MNPVTGPVAITGASGLIGSALADALADRGVEVLRLVRRPVRGPQEARWDPLTGEVDEASLGRASAVVHLAGENLAGGRWTETRKRRILESRDAGTRLIAETMARLDGPRVLIAASAIGYYGDRGEAIMRESDGPGEGFLPAVTVAWEEALEPAARTGIRVAQLRSGLVLSPLGGVLAKLLLPFRWGLGARLGSGRQWMSWITLRDQVNVILAALADERYEGPINAVSPMPVRNAEFTRLLARALRRPAFLVLPACLLRLAFGLMAEEALLGSTRVAPERLQTLGFAFQDPELGPALEYMLRR